MVMKFGIEIWISALLAACNLSRPALAFHSRLFRSSLCSQGPQSIKFHATSTEDQDDLSNVLLKRLPTSVEDQVRQATEALARAAADGKHRHSMRLLLPVIGATDLDDWPGGARQMMEAAYPLMIDTLKGMGAKEFQQVLVDASDGVYAIYGEGEQAKDDSCTVLLPSADTVSQIEELEKQVGDKRNLIIVNPQWKRKSDFGGWFGSGDKAAKYIEQFEPTFSLTNLIVEGENIRVLRTYPGPWRVFARQKVDGVVEWNEVGRKEIVPEKPDNWEDLPQNKRDGGLLFAYGLPTYQEILDMLTSSPNYTPKNPAEKAMASLAFIKDTL